MEAELRALIGKYGIKDVHQELEKQCREAYEYLQKTYSPTQNPIVPKTPPAPAAPKPSKIIKNTTIIPEIVHREEPQPVPEVAKVIAEVTLSKTVDPDVKTVTITKQKTIEEKKQEKQQHRDAVELKRQELIGKGVNPESLLTKENLQKWLGSNLSYMKIARDHVGLHETTISSVAKSFGLQSAIAQAAIMKRS